MNIYRNISNLPDLKRPVITIGSFDGLHLGHKALISQIKKLSEDQNSEYVLITFEPHPRQIIYPKDSTLKLLTTLEEKIYLFNQLNVSNLTIAEFSVEFSQISADEYIENFLIGKFNPSVIVIGYDHRFGLNRSGDIHYLKWYSAKGNYTVQEIDPKMVDELIISSTKIRNAIESSQISIANAMLGHHYFMIGNVIHGQKIGKTLGFPTANIEIKNKLKLIPPFGIYAVFAHIDQKIYHGVLYIGFKTSVQPEQLIRNIELHIFDFDNDIYNEEVIVEFVSFLRSDRHFDDLESLAEQIQADADQAKSLLKNEKPSFSYN
jgi:riboflavin kinase/FMN adenylyltransferase